MEDDDGWLVLPRPRAEDELAFLLLPRLEEEPPLAAGFVREDFPAEASLLDELVLLAVLLDEDLVADDFFATALLEEPPLRDAELPLLEDEVLLPPRDELLFDEADFLAATRDAPPLEADLLAPRDALTDFFAPREVVLRAELLLDAPPFFATRFLVVLLAEARPLFAEVFLAAVLEEDFLAAVFLAGDFFAADFLAAPLAGDFEAALFEPLLEDLDAVLEPPRPVDRPLEAALLRPEDLDADLDEDLPPALFEEVFLEAAFLVDFAIVNGF